MGAFWDKHSGTIDRARFRDEEQYLGEQYNKPDDPRARAMFEHVRDQIASRPEWAGVLSILTEDGAFGCRTAVVDGVTVSRDLLDSIVELEFLRRACPPGFLLDARVLDIGAGYGRLAHRWLKAFPLARFTCTDPVFVSREVCAAYLEYRGIALSQARVRAPEDLSTGPYDLAVNIHSWPECSREEIRWWLKWLAGRAYVPRLFVIPHLSGMICNEDGQPFQAEIESVGYRLETYWRGPDCWPRDFFLFRLGSTT